MWSDRFDLRAESHSIDLDEALGKSASSFCPLSASILLSPDKSFGSGEGVTTFQSHCRRSARVAARLLSESYPSAFSRNDKNDSRQQRCGITKGVMFEGRAGGRKSACQQKRA